MTEPAKTGRSTQPGLQPRHSEDGGAWFTQPRGDSAFPAPSNTRPSKT